MGPPSVDAKRRKIRTTEDAMTSTDYTLLEPPPDQIPRMDIDVFAREVGMIQPITKLITLYYKTIHIIDKSYERPSDSTGAGQFLDGVNALIKLSSELSRMYESRPVATYIKQKNRRYAERIQEWAIELYSAVLNSLERRKCEAGIDETLPETFRFFCVIAHRHTLGFDIPTVKNYAIAHNALPAMSIFQLSSLYSFVGEPELAQCCKLLAIKIIDDSHEKIPSTLQLAGVFLRSLRVASDQTRDMDSLKDALRSSFNVSPLNMGVSYLSASDYDISQIVEDTLRKHTPIVIAQWKRDAPRSGGVYQIAETVITYTVSSLALLNTTSPIQTNLIGEIMSYRFLVESKDWWHVAAFIVSHAETCSFVFDRIRPNNTPYFPSNAELAGRICKCSRLLVDTATKGNECDESMFAALEDCAAVSITLLRYMCILDYSPSLKVSENGTYSLTLSGAGEYIVLSFGVETMSADGTSTMIVKVAKESALDLQSLKGTTNEQHGTSVRVHNQWMSAAMFEDFLFIAVWMYRIEYLNAASTVRVIIRGSDMSSRVMFRIAGNDRANSDISPVNGVEFPKRSGHTSNSAGEQERMTTLTVPGKEWAKQRDDANMSMTRCLFFLYALRITDAQCAWCSRLGCLVQMMHIISSCRLEDEYTVNYVRRRFIFLACSSILILEHIFLHHHHCVQQALVDIDGVVFGVLSHGSQIASDTLVHLTEALKLAKTRITVTEGMLMDRMWSLDSLHWGVWGLLKQKLGYRLPNIRNYDATRKLLTSTKHFTHMADLDHYNDRRAYGCIYDYNAQTHAPTVTRQKFIIEKPHDVARSALADSSAFRIL
jgi:hypothetical protein